MNPLFQAIKERLAHSYNTHTTEYLNRNRTKCDELHFIVREITYFIGTADLGDGTYYILYGLFDNKITSRRRFIIPNPKIDRENLQQTILELPSIIVQFEAFREDPIPALLGEYVDDLLLVFMRNDEAKFIKNVGQFIFHSHTQREVHNSLARPAILLKPELEKIAQEFGCEEQFNNQWDLLTSSLETAERLL